MKTPVLSVIIVTFNSSDVIQDCLTSLLLTKVLTEIIIIDNSSSDKTISLILNFIHNNPTQKIILIQQTRNSGYAAGINTGLNKAKGSYVMLLGPDTRLQKNAASTLITVLENDHQIGMTAPRLMDEKGKTYNSIRTFPRINDLFFELCGLPRLFPKRFLPAWKLPDFDYTIPAEIDQPEASCLLCRNEAITHVGFMDERFTMFFNDVDWCLRFKKSGWKIYFQPAAEVIHLKGTSIYANRVRMIWKSHQGFFRFFRKYTPAGFKQINVILLGLLLIITAVLRSFFQMIR